MKFGDGQSWENFVNELLEETKGDRDKLYYKANENDLIIKNIKKYKPNGGKLLDCGSHIGRWFRYFEDAGFNYIGIDQSKDAIEVAKKYWPDNKEKFINRFLWDMDFNSEFDVVVSISMLQHNRLVEKKKILPRIYNALKDDGDSVFFMMESTVSKETNTQLTTSGWISLIENNGFKFIESWHPSIDKNSGDTLNDCYLFKKIPGLDIRVVEMKKGSDEELDYYVETCYLNILGRGADDLGRKNYVDLIKSGRMKRQELPIELRSSDEYKNRFKKIIEKTEEGMI